MMCFIFFTDFLHKKIINEFEYIRCIGRSKNVIRTRSSRTTHANFLHDISKSRTWSTKEEEEKLENKSCSCSE